MINLCLRTSIIVIIHCYYLIKIINNLMIKQNDIYKNKDQALFYIILLRYYSKIKKIYLSFIPNSKALPL